MPRLSVGDAAPNFDLASTEDVVLMLRDEIPRSAVLLYFFDGPDNKRARRDLTELAARHTSFAGLDMKILGISATKLEELRTLQRELELPFPLLFDDRGFSSLFGFEVGEGGGAEPVMVLVNRDQRVLWLGDGSAELETSLGEVEGRLESLPSSTANYPRSVINRLVDLWVN